MRRVTLLLLAVVIALSVGSGLALAKSINGGAGNDHLVGNVGKDTISGGGGKDRIFGKGARDRLSGDAGGDEVHGNEGPDSIFGGNGRDDLFGNEGNDFHNVFDEQPNDRVNCGPGNDTAITDIGLTGQRIDIFENCETIFLPIPIDPCELACPNRTGQQTDLSTLGREDVKRAVEDGLLRKTEG
jgi:Ca2+-binding RTX toxin-like protein